eukprot:1558460-Ditylum_brightwellii.AAC.1
MTRKKCFENVKPSKLCAIKANRDIYSKYRNHKQEIETYEIKQQHVRNHDQQDQAEHVATFNSDGMVVLDGGDGFVAFGNPISFEERDGNADDDHLLNQEVT